MAGSIKRPRKDWFYTSQNFGALPPELSKVDTSRFVILPVPYEKSTTYRAGCRQGPAAIIEASANMELYDEELRFEPCKAGIHTSAPLEAVDEPEEMLERVEAAVAVHLRKGKFVGVLGGEHTVTLGAVGAYRRMYSDLSVLFLDAHADFRESYRGNKYNHGCVARRISELCGVILVGVRSLSGEEAAALRRGHVETYWGHEFRSSRVSKERELLTRRAVGGLSSNVYISIDMDVFDPSVMPAVGTPEPGGLLWDEVLGLIRQVAEEKNLVGADLVELAPVAGLIHPEFTAARLLYKFFGYVVKNH